MSEATGPKTTRRSWSPGRTWTEAAARASAGMRFETSCGVAAVGSVSSVGGCDSLSTVSVPAAGGLSRSGVGTSAAASVESTSRTTITITSRLAAISAAGSRDRASRRR
jgi:hypothetical protein